MVLAVALLIHALALIAGLLTLTLLAQVRFMANLWVRVITGAGAGVGSAWYLRGVAPFLSYTESSLAGDLGLGGYVYLLGFASLLIVWAYNLITTEEVLVR